MTLGPDAPGCRRHAPAEAYHGSQARQEIPGRAGQSRRCRAAVTPSKPASTTTCSPSSAATTRTATSSPSAATRSDERYAIPYNGEEVYLYWANHDQYYVKTAEHFTDYTFTAPNGVTVHFKLQAADVEQNNVKGEKRFFLPRPAEIFVGRGRGPTRDPLRVPAADRAGEHRLRRRRTSRRRSSPEALKDIPKRLPPTDRRARRWPP